MSILRQLLLSISIAMTVILLGTLALNIAGARDYLADQLQAQSTDAAVSLALTLSQPGNGEPVMQELLISALFDGGHFARVALISPEKQPLIVREIEGTPRYAAPDWFRAMMPIGTKSASSAVSDGWRQIGEVTVTANDVYAWETLWASSLRMITLVVAAGLAWTLFAFLLVNWIKRRLLAEISAQVRAIGQGQLQGSEITARVPELAGVAQALNQARERLRITAAEQEAKVEALELELNRDETTGIANRRYFLNEFRRALGEDDSQRQDCGHVMILHLCDLAGLNQHAGRRPTDQWLNAVCQKVAAILPAAETSPSPAQPAACLPALLARLNGADFAVLIPENDPARASTLAGQIRSALRQTPAPTKDSTLCRWTLSLTRYTPGDGISAVLTRLDQGLTQAEESGSDEVVTVP